MGIGRILGREIDESEFCDLIIDKKARIANKNDICILCRKPCNRMILSGKKTIVIVHEKCQREYNAEWDFKYFQNKYRS